MTKKTKKLTMVSVNGKARFVWATPSEDGKTRVDLGKIFPDVYRRGHCIYVG